jgi:hypothetical protein
VDVLTKPKRISRAQTPACRRKAERQPFDGKVVIGLSESEGSIGRMRNISPFGCNVQVKADWLRVGRIVSLKVSADRTIQAIVRWTRDDQAGLEFLRAIDLAEAEWLDGEA